MQRLTLVSGAALAALVLGGCASKVPLNDTAATSATAAPVAAAPQAPAAAQPSPAAQSDVAAVDLTQQRGANSFAELARTVYFDFDSFAIRPDFKPVVEGHAQRLNADRNGRLVIAGHADERGSREYNLALGQKRAEAVVRSLVLLGVGERQLEAVSFGEERPAAQGSDESAWARNRRAEIKDR